mgnify:CR=1 FL=1
MRMTLMMCASLLATRVLAADEHVHGAPAVDMPHAIAVPEGVRAPSAQEMAAAFPDLGGMQMKDHMGSTSLFFVSADRLEAQREGDETAAVWEAKVGWGGDHDRLWLESSGERVEGESESLETRLYWTRAVSRWWDAAVGLRQDGGEGDPRRWVSVGVQGLAPYFVETQLHLFVGESGRTALAVELEYDARLTQRLILQPVVEVTAYGKEDAANGVGRGLAELEAGLRLRYEVRREIAPYIGVEWSRHLGDTADRVRDAGGEVSHSAAVMGVRLWY